MCSIIVLSRSSSSTAVSMLRRLISFSISFSIYVCVFLFLCIRMGIFMVSFILLLFFVHVCLGLCFWVISLVVFGDVG